MGVKSNLKLIFSYFRLNVKKEWQYKSSFFMQMIMMILNDAFFLIQWIIVFSLVDNIGGYTFNDTMLLWAIFTGGFGVAHTFFQGAWNIKDLVYDGKLDVFLTQPKNVLINVCCSSTKVSAIGDIIYAFIILIIINAPWWWFLAIIPISILSGLLLVSVYVTYCSLSFYINRGDAVGEVVEDTMCKSGTYPPSIFSGVTRWLFYSLIPTFFFAFVPAKYILGTFNIWWVLGLLGFVILWVIIAFVSFNRGLKRYNSGNIISARM